MHGKAPMRDLFTLATQSRLQVIVYLAEHVWSGKLMARATPIGEIGIIYFEFKLVPKVNV